MKPLVLSGFMATGKSTLGAEVSRALGVPFVDTDAVLAAQTGRSVAELFAGEGEARFRELEAELVMPLLADPSPKVIAFGGGTVTIPAVRHAALEAATVVTLSASPESIVARVVDLTGRPNLGRSSPLSRTRDLLALRREAYAECHATIDTEGRSVAELTAKVVAIAGRDALAVPLGTRSYAVTFEDERSATLAEVLADLQPTSVVAVTDANVARARGGWLDLGLAGAGPRIDVVLEPGERNKTLAAVGRIWDAALARGVDRQGVVVAFGGGVVGDLAGFAASTLLRGLRCVQIPTSLLAMVDSSVGGKTGFDHAAGKNLIGSFFQPNRVIVDVAHLGTLPPRERAAGLAEVVKIALACDAELLAEVERSADALARGDRAVSRSVIRRAVLAKIRVVRDDERETGARGLLNLGHTVGHALEAHGGYDRWLHGEAVALGTLVEMEATERLGLTPSGSTARARALFAKLALPTSVHREEVEAAWPFVFADKKRGGDRLKLPVVVGEGAGRMEAMTFEALREAILAGAIGSPSQVFGD